MRKNQETIHPYERLIIHDMDELVELERQANNALLIKYAIGGLLPGLADTEIALIHEVLEIGCGPGSWCLGLAQTYHQMQITGVDTSRIMIAHANAEAQDRYLDHIRYFQVQNLVGPFAFADNSFDLISAQFLSQVLSKDSWLMMVRECRRMLRPGGKLRLTDCETPQSNAPAHEEWWSLYIHAMCQLGRSFSPSDRHLGILCGLEPLLIEAGFRDTRTIGHMINYSHGSPLHREWKKDFLIFSKGIQPMLVDLRLTTQEHLEMLEQQMQKEMHLQNFHSIVPLLTVLGQK